MKIKGAKKLFFDDLTGNSSSFDRLFDVICIIDTDQKILYSNKSFQTFVQFDKNTLLNSTFKDAISLNIDTAEDPFTQSKEKQKYIGIREISGTLQDQNEVSLQIGVQPLFNRENDSELLGFLVSIQDKSLEFNLHKKYKVVIDKIEEEFNESVRVFSNMVDMIDSKSDYSSRISQLAKQMAIQLNLSEKEVRDVEVAGRLHKIGTLGMNPSTLEKPYEELNAIEKKEFEKYPILGALIFDGIKAFEQICEYIRTHREHYDGKGFPGKLKGDEIPIGAAILCLAHDFCYIVGDTHQEDISQDLVDRIQKNQEIIYHPLAVDSFLEVMSQKSSFIQKMERKKIQLEDLKNGMKLASHLYSSKGILLMQSEERISIASLKRIHRFHENDPITSEIEIYAAVDQDILAERFKKAKTKQKFNILVVDDTIDLNMLICLMINKCERYNAVGVHSGQDALNKLKEEAFDAIILDIMMPKMSGLETLQHIRSTKQNLPIIMCTAKSEHTDVIEAFKLGADDYLVKPVLSEPLIEGLDKAIQFQQKNEDGKPDYKIIRKQQMFSVLKQVAPEFLLKNKKESSTVRVKYKTIPVSPQNDGIHYNGSALKISKAGFSLTSKEQHSIGQRIAFSLSNDPDAKVLLTGIGNIISKKDMGSEQQYQVEFISIRKPEPSS